MAQFWKPATETPANSNGPKVSGHAAVVTHSSTHAPYLHLNDPSAQIQGNKYFIMMQKVMLDIATAATTGSALANRLKRSDLQSVALMYKVAKSSLDVFSYFWCAPAYAMDMSPLHIILQVFSVLGWMGCAAAYVFKVEPDWARTCCHTGFMSGHDWNHLGHCNAIRIVARRECTFSTWTLSMWITVSLGIFLLLFSLLHYIVVMAYFYSQTGTLVKRYMSSTYSLFSNTLASLDANKKTADAAEFKDFLNDPYTKEHVDLLVHETLDYSSHHARGLAHEMNVRKSKLKNRHTTAESMV